MAKLWKVGLWVGTVLTGILVATIGDALGPVFNPMAERAFAGVLPQETSDSKLTPAPHSHPELDALVEQSRTLLALIESERLDPPADPATDASPPPCEPTFGAWQSCASRALLAADPQGSLAGWSHGGCGKAERSPGTSGPRLRLANADCGNFVHQGFAPPAGPLLLRYAVAIDPSASTPSEQVVELLSGWPGPAPDVYAVWLSVQGTTLHAAAYTADPVGTARKIPFDPEGAWTTVEVLLDPVDATVLVRIDGGEPFLLKGTARNAAPTTLIVGDTSGCDCRSGPAAEATYEGVVLLGISATSRDR